MCLLAGQGHAAGGQNIKIITATGGRRFTTDQDDGTWITINPLIRMDGTLAWNAIVKRGSLLINTAEFNEQFGDNLIIGTSKTGYSNAILNLEMWKLGVAQMKEDPRYLDEYGMLRPMFVWMDNCAFLPVLSLFSLCVARSIPLP